MSFFEDWLIPLLADHGLIVVFVTMVAESACVLIPSEIVMPYGGFLAAQGHTQLWKVIAVTVLANLVGSLIAYTVGRYGGRALFLRYGRYVGAKAHHLEKAERWFDRYGELTVLFTRVIPGVRTFISLPAGMVSMPVGKFTLYSLVGIVPWVAALTSLGYAAGKAAGEDPWGNLQAQFHRYDLIIYGVIGAAVVGFIAWRILKRKRTRQAQVQSAQVASDPNDAQTPPQGD
ncbi:MAG: DedA family protein [Thermoleophilia bacterium]|nr:DedA family protein [Thermoleophilia bacterium]